MKALLLRVFLLFCIVTVTVAQIVRIGIDDQSIEFEGPSLYEGGIESGGDVDFYACIRTNEGNWGHIIYWVRYVDHTMPLPSTDASGWSKVSLNLVLSHFKDEIDPELLEVFPVHMYGSVEVVVPGDGYGYVELTDGRTVRLSTFC